jgi:hypothetical protein
MVAGELDKAVEEAEVLEPFSRTADDVQARLPRAMTYDPAD